MQIHCILYMWMFTRCLLWTCTITSKLYHSNISDIDWFAIHQTISLIFFILINFPLVAIRFFLCVCVVGFLWLTWGVTDYSWKLVSIALLSLTALWFQSLKQDFILLSKCLILMAMSMWTRRNFRRYGMSFHIGLYDTMLPSHSNW